jgi:hypothetical protein
METGMTNHRGYAVSIAVLFFMIALAMGCTAPVQEPSRYQPPLGMGAVRLELNVDNKNTRTILPNAATLASFVAFEFDFTVVSGDEAEAKNRVVPYAQRSIPIDLMPGEYNLTVTGYMEYNSSLDYGKPASIGMPDTSITVTEAGYGSVKVTLKPIIAPVPGLTLENGTYSWNINTTNAPTATGTMVITPRSGGGGGTNIPFSNPADWTGTQTLAPGNYNVDFTIQATDDSTLKFRHVLQVYYNMTSHFAYTIPNLSGSSTGSVSVTWVEIPNIPADQAPSITVAGSYTLSDLPSVPVTLAIDNFDIFTSMTWEFGGTTLETDHTFALNGGAPLNAVGTYDVTVTGIVDGVPYSIIITIVLE